jgi:hypothetical protein
MQNGNAITAPIFLLLLLGLSCTSVSAQKKDSAIFDADYPSFKVDEECKSKSERTAKPTIVKFSKEKLEAVKTVKELIKDIPEHCEVLCVFISIKKPDDKVFEFRNIGNEMVYANRLTTGKFIMVESLATSCPTLHKANYKILIDDGTAKRK